VCTYKYMHRDRYTLGFHDTHTHYSKVAINSNVEIISLRTRESKEKLLVKTRNDCIHWAICI